MKGGLPAAAVAEGPKAQRLGSFQAQLPRAVQVGEDLGAPGQGVAGAALY